MCSKPSCRDPKVRPSSGIGKQAALDFAARGARLFLTARRGQRLQSLVEQIHTNGGNASIHPCDLSDASQRDGLIASIRRQAEAPDILINNAGYGNFRPFTQENPEEIQRMTQVNYLAAAHLMSAFLDDMLKRGSGAVVNISSGAGRVVIPGMGIYCATKFALCALTQAAYYETFGRGVSVHLINPGPVETEFFDAGEWKGPRHQKTAKPSDVTAAIFNALESGRFEVFVPSKRGWMAYVFNLLGPLGHKVMIRKAGLGR